MNMRNALEQAFLNQINHRLTMLTIAIHKQVTEAVMSARAQKPLVADIDGIMDLISERISELSADNT